MGENEKVTTPEAWVNFKKIQEFLGGSSREAVYSAIERGMPASKFGSRWMFKISEVEAWMRSGQAARETENDESNDT